MDLTPRVFLLSHFFFFSFKKCCLSSTCCPLFYLCIYFYVFFFSPLSITLPLFPSTLFFFFFFKMENHDRAIFFGKLRELAPSCSKHTSLCPLHVGLKYNFCQSMLALFAATTHSASGWGDVVKLVDRYWRLQVLSKVLSSEAWVWSQQSFLL